jgi:hypothetical protein
MSEDQPGLLRGNTPSAREQDEKNTELQEKQPGYNGPDDLEAESKFHDSQNRSRAKGVSDWAESERKRRNQQDSLNEPFWSGFFGTSLHGRGYP